MMFGWFIDRKTNPKSEAEETLEKIRDILFPDLATRVDENGTKYHIDYSTDANLASALSDLEEGLNDENVRRTLSTMVDRLMEARFLLNASPKFDPDAKYFVFDDGSDPVDPESIETDG